MKTIVAIFTAIDATLLDARTFEAGVNRAAVRRLVSSGVPVIPVSTMTLDELTPIASSLGLRHPMIIEGGGAIARRRGTQWEIEPCGPPAETMLDAVLEIEDRSGADLLISDAPGQHRFSEPFVLERGDLAAVRDAAASLGYSIRRGRRFLHLARRGDEGKAFARVRDELRCEMTIAVGGSAVDAEYLTRADIAIIIPGPDGSVDAELLDKVPHAFVSPAPAPEGWALAIDQLRPNATSTRTAANQTMPRSQ